MEVAADAAEREEAEDSVARITVTRTEAAAVVVADPVAEVEEEEVVMEAEEDSAVEEVAEAAQDTVEEAVEAVGAALPAPEAAEAAAITGAPAGVQTTGGEKRGAVSSSVRVILRILFPPPLLSRYYHLLA